MILIIECILLCLITTAIILPTLYKDPLSHIMSYPKPIRERVESLSQYKDIILAKEKRHISKKIISVFIIALILAIVSYFSGANTFKTAFKHVFIMFLAFNLYDVIVLDLWLFCYNPRVRIPGTEDMDQAYKDPWHHIKGGVKGLLIGVIVAFFSATLVHMF